MRSSYQNITLLSHHQHVFSPGCSFESADFVVFSSVIDLNLSALFQLYLKELNSCIIKDDFLSHCWFFFLTAQMRQ